MNKTKQKFQIGAAGMFIAARQIWRRRKIIREKRWWQFAYVITVPFCTYKRGRVTLAECVITSFGSLDHHQLQLQVYPLGLVLFSSWIRDSKFTTFTSLSSRCFLRPELLLLPGSNQKKKCQPNFRFPLVVRIFIFLSPPCFVVVRKLRLIHSEWKFSLSLIPLLEWWVRKASKSNWGTVIVVVSFCWYSTAWSRSRCVCSIPFPSRDFRHHFLPWKKKWNHE